MKTIDEETWEEIIEEANFQDAMDDSAQEELEEMLEEEENLKKNQFELFNL